MKCLRCGYCCKWLCVIIVDDPEKGISEDNLIAHNGQGQLCKHLLGDKPGEYSCALHDKEWYEDTPCFRYTQIEPPEGRPCRMGEYTLTKEKVRQ